MLKYDIESKPPMNVRPVKKSARILNFFPVGILNSFLSPVISHEKFFSVINFKKKYKEVSFCFLFVQKKHKQTNFSFPHGLLKIMI